MAGRLTNNLTGRRFGRWTVLKRSDATRIGQPLWWCQCDCGVRRDVFGHSLRGGISQSCGCLKQELTRERSRANNFHLKHGDTKVIDGKVLATKEYTVWCNMKQRCYYEKAINYKNYGGRGIWVCKKWLNSFECFLEDMGRAPSPKHSIDRKNNNGNYTPKNCRWATSKQQVNNRRVLKQSQ